MSEKNKPEVFEQQTEPVPTAAPGTDARRRLLKCLATGSGVIAAGGMLPGKWTAPVVKSVILPAHAESSPGGEGGTPTPTECAEQLSEIACLAGTLGPIKRYTNADNPYACGDLTILDSDTCEEATSANQLLNNDKVGFVMTGVADSVVSATAGFQEVGDDPATDAIQSSKCVDRTSENGGTLDWDTSNGKRPSAAVGSTPGCLQLVVRYHCASGCGGGAGKGCILGYVQVIDSDPCE